MSSFGANEIRNEKGRQKTKILMCVFNHDEVKGSQATILIIIQCLCGLIRRSGLIHSHRIGIPNFALNTVLGVSVTKSQFYHAWHF